MLKEKTSLLQKHEEHLFEKKFGTTLLTPSNSRHQLEIYLQNTKSPFHSAPHTHREKARSKSFFSLKLDQKVLH